jgi:hypothetical protein
MKNSFHNSSNQNKIYNSNNYDNEIFSNEDNDNKKIKMKRVSIIENKKTGEKEIINYDNGKKINDIILNINDDGDEILINKNTGLSIDMNNYIIDKENGKKIFLIPDDINKNNNQINENETNNFETFNNNKYKNYDINN